MQNNLKEFISEALCKPADYLAYFASVKLAEMYPEAAIIENESWCFNVPEYAEAGRCSIWPHDSVHCQAQLKWQSEAEPFEREIENGWLNVLWPAEGREHFLDVVFLTWNDAGCETTRRWIIAESEEIAEKFLRAVCAYCSSVHGEILVFEDGHWEKDEKLFASIKNASFDNLILPPQLKQELREDFRRFFASREIYRQYGIPWKRGALLTGPPGNGKTHAIKALTNELNLPCLYIKSFKSDRGSEQGNMQAVFARARKTAPCLVVMEDLDSLIEDENRAFLLNELDGFAANEGVLVIASTNHPEKLDPAILDRPSRFDRKYLFALPALAERLAYVKFWNQSLQPEMQLTSEEAIAVAKRTEEFSFAYLKELFLSAMMLWAGTQLGDQAGRKMCELILERASLLREQLRGGRKISAAAAVHSSR